MDPASTVSGSDVDKRARRRIRSHWHPGDWILGTSKGQWTFLLSVGFSFIVIGSFLWKLTGGNDDYDATFWQSAWISWGLFFDPGTQTGIPATDPWCVQLVAVILSVMGFIFNLSILGLVVDLIRGKLRQFKEVRSRVVANDHILVLGWGDRTLFLLTELKAAERRTGRSMSTEEQAPGCARRCACRCRQQGRHIVVLAQKPVLDMEQQVNMHLAYYGIDPGWISYRMGDPTDRSELEKVSAITANDILIMSSGRGLRKADQGVVQSLLALAALPDFHCYLGDVFVEMHTRQGVSVARELLPIAEGIVARHAVNRILVLRSLAPPIGYCYLDMVSFKEGQELYVRPVPRELVGTLFRDTCRHFPEAVVCGLIKGSRDEEEVTGPFEGLIPHTGRVLKERDQLVLLAPTSTSAEKCQHDTALGLALPQARGQSRRIEEFKPDGRLNIGYWINSPRMILLVGCPADFVDILEILDYYLAAGSVVHMLSERPVSDRNAKLYRHFGPTSRSSEAGKIWKHITVVHVVGSTTCQWALSELPLTTADCVIVLSEHHSEDEPPSAADSRNLTTVISIRGLLCDLGRHKGKSNCKVVIELQDPRSQQVVEGNSGVRRHGSFVYTSALETALFAMAAEEKLVYSTLMELLTPSSGAGHIAAVPIRDFVDAGENISYLDLHSRIFDACGGVLLGWKLKSSRYPELNPEDKGSSRVKREDDSDVLLFLRPGPAPQAAPLEARSPTPLSGGESGDQGGAQPRFPGAVCSEPEIPAK